MPSDGEDTLSDEALLSIAIEFDGGGTSSAESVKRMDEAAVQPPTSAEDDHWEDIFDDESVCAALEGQLVAKADLPSPAKPTTPDPLIDSADHRSKRRRIIPGPAGCFVSQDSDQISSERSRRPVGRYLENIDPSTKKGDSYFRGAVWLSFLEDNDLPPFNPPEDLMPYSIALIHAGRTQDRKIDIAVVVKAFDPENVEKGATLSDPTGEIKGLIHPSIKDNAGTDKEVSAGCVLLLHQVSVFSPSPRSHYVNIIPDNIMKVYYPSACRTEDTIAHLAQSYDPLSAYEVNARPCNITRAPLASRRQPMSPAARHGYAQGSGAGQRSNMGHSRHIHSQHPALTPSPSSGGAHARGGYSHGSGSGKENIPSPASRGRGFSQRGGKRGGGDGGWYRGSSGYIPGRGRGGGRGYGGRGYSENG
eukprot:Rmarinus@m.1160